MTTSSADEEINPTDNTEDALLDSLSASLKKLLNKGKSRGYITVDELNGALPPEKESSEQIEDVMAMISDMGINLIENDEAEEEPAESEEDDGFKLDETEVSRTDDPVRMYLREMGAVELLSREGEIAIAKRIEAGRDLMIGGLCESALTIKALSGWHNALISGKMLLRDIIDLDATYGSDEDAPALSLATSLPSAAVMAEESSVVQTVPDNAAEKDEEEDYEEYDEEESDEEYDESEDSDIDDEEDGEEYEDDAEEEEEETSEEDAGDEEDAGEDDSPSVSLAQMEQSLMPQVLEQFDQILSMHQKLKKVQDQRLACIRTAKPVPAATEKKFEKIKQELVSLMEGVQLNPARIEMLVDQLNEYNKRLMTLEGKMLRMAISCRIKREDFLEAYKESEFDSNWIQKTTGKAWKTFTEKYAHEISDIQNAVSSMAEEIGMPIFEYRRICSMV